MKGEWSAPLTGALRETFRETRRLLFSPVRPDRWWLLALPAWLSILGISGINVPVDRLADEEFLGWLRDDPLKGWTVAGFLAAALLAVGLAIEWLRARGLLMFLDCLVRSEAGVRGPWVRQAAKANSLFVVRLAISVVAVLFVASLVFLAILCLRGETMDLGTIEAEDALCLGCLAGAILAGLLGFGTVFLLIDDVFCPVLLSRGGGIREAAVAAWELVRRNVDEFSVYLLFRWAMGVVAFGTAAVVVCATCCLALLPYLGTALLLPLHAVWRYYPLFFLRRLGCDVWMGVGVASPVLGEAPTPPSAARVPPRLEVRSP